MDRDLIVSKSPAGARRLPDPAFWAGRRVLLTGHTGFKGAWAALWLERLGAIVTGFGLPPAQTPNLYETAGVAAALASHFVDLRDRGLMGMILESLQFDVALHLATPAIQDTEPAEPADSLLEVLQAFGGVNAVLIATEDDSDSSARTQRAHQALVMGPRASILHRSGVSVATAHCGALLGGGDYGHDRLAPRILRAYEADAPLILENADAVRAWRHVLEAVASLLLHLEDLTANRSAPHYIDVEPTRESPALDQRQLAMAAFKALNVRPNWCASDQAVDVSLPRPGAPARAERVMGGTSAFQPQLGAREALAWTLKWYRAVASGKAPKAATLSQIVAYEHI